MAEIKPCPFCGGEAELRVRSYPGGPTYQIRCLSCPGGTPETFPEGKAVDTWNQRTPQGEPVGAIGCLLYSDAGQYHVHWYEEVPPKGTKLYTKPEAQRESGEREALAGLFKMIREQSKHTNWAVPADWACIECRPTSDILKLGFQCAFHRAKALLTTPTVEPTESQGSDGWKERVRWLEKDNVRLKEQLGDDVWYWQGDGEDDLESLTCPVVITPDQLRSLLTPPQPDRVEREHQAFTVLEEFGGTLEMYGNPDGAHTFRYTRRSGWSTDGATPVEALLPDAILSGTDGGDQREYDVACRPNGTLRPDPAPTEKGENDG